MGTRGWPLCVTMMAMLAGCVTEKPRSNRGTPVRPLSEGQAAAYSGPVAERARGTTINARVAVALTPLGVVRYDGQVLPVTSPDGRFVAVQEGDPPDWPTLLAEPGATPPSTSSVGVYEVTDAGLNRIETAEPAPGILLGRGADDRGVIVEWPREDGSRWIGRMAWVSGQVEWIVQGSEVNAHATILRDGSLVFTRRAVGEPYATLVLKTGAGEAVKAATDGSYSMPMATDEPGMIYAFVRTKAGTDIEGVRVNARKTLGSSQGRRRMSASADPAMAYQIASTVAWAFPAPADGNSPARIDPLVMLHPDLGRMVVFSPGAPAFGLLAPSAFAAARCRPGAGPEDGYFCATPDGLVFSFEPRLDQPEATRRPDIRVITGQFVPRATTNPSRPMILFSPVRGDPTRMQLLGMRLAEPQ